MTGLIYHGVGDLFGANAFFAETGEGFGDVLGGDLAGEDETGTAGGGVLDDFTRGARPAHAFLELGEGAFGDVRAEGGKVRDYATTAVGAAFVQFDGLELWHGCDLDFEASAAGGVEAGAREGGFDFGAEAGESRQEGAREEIERRGEWIVRAAFQGQARGATSEDQRGQDRLQNQRGAAGGSDGEAIFARADLLRSEDQFARANLRAIGHRVSDLRRGQHGGEVLAQQAGLFAPGADVDNPKRLPGDERERQRSAEDLPSALAG